MNGIYIEITNVCNLKCSFCPSHTLTERRFMDAELFTRALGEASKIAPNIYFHVLGEPTLHPHFENFLQVLEKENSSKLNLTTNGTTIEKCREILLRSNAIRQINFSTHAYAELPFDEACRHLKNVLDFCNEALKLRPELYINLRLWNVGDSFSNSWNNYMLSEVNKAFETDVQPGHFCSRHKSFLVKGRLYLHEDSRFEWPKIAPPEKNVFAKGTCRALDTHVGILSDGRVVACCLDYKGAITLGNIQENTLEEILSSPLANNLREGFARHELRHPLCINCNFCKRFK